MVATLLLLLAAEGSLVPKLAEVMDAPDYRGARWGVLIVEADGGKVVYERNADQLFAPASVTKLYTCAAAMLALVDEFNDDLAAGFRIDPKVREDLAHFLVLRGAFAL